MSFSNGFKHWTGKNDLIPNEGEKNLFGIRDWHDLILNDIEMKIQSEELPRDFLSLSLSSLLAKFVVE